MTDSSKDFEPWLSALQRALHRLPQDYHRRRDGIADMRHVILREFATALEGPLNEHVKSLPHASLEDKRRVATSVNAELRDLNLAVRCPVTNLGATLVALPGHAPGSSKFRFQSFDAAGRRWQKGMADELPRLVLIEASPRIESLAMRRRSHNR